jgi:DnaA family protein
VAERVPGLRALGGAHGSSGQLALDLRLDDQASFRSFFSGANLEAVNHCRALAEGRNDVIVLWGPLGSGRSHLLQAACRLAGECDRRAYFLPLGAMGGRLPASAFTGLEVMDLVCVDDIQVAAGQRDWEEGLFHLFNGVREAGAGILVGADAPPARLPLRLADLRSRLEGALVLRLKALTDDERLAALQHRARLRGIELPDAVGRYLLTRFQRDSCSLFALLDRLDQAALAAGRRLTVPFVRAVLERSQPEGGFSRS